MAVPKYGVHVAGTRVVFLNGTQAFVVEMTLYYALSNRCIVLLHDLLVIMYPDTSVYTVQVALYMCIYSLAPCLLHVCT